MDFSLQIVLLNKNNYRRQKYCKISVNKRINDQLINVMINLIIFILFNRKSTMSAILKFNECSQIVTEKTPIWKYFLREISGEFAKCKNCKKVLKTSGKSTSGLHKQRKSAQF